MKLKKERNKKMDKQEKILEHQEEIKKLQTEIMKEKLKRDFRPIIKEVLEEIKAEEK